MVQRVFLWLSCVLLTVSGGENDVFLDADPTQETMTQQQLAEAEMRLSDQIRLILEHYKQKDPVGIPGAQVPDPMPVPDITKSLPMATMKMNNIFLYGLSRFRVDYIKTDVAQMEVSMRVRIEQLHIEGKYTVSYLFSKSQGTFNITLDDVVTEGAARLVVGRNGMLHAQDIDMNIEFASMNMHLENPRLSSFLRGIISSAAPAIFEAAKPSIMKEVNENIRNDINKQVSQYHHVLPNSITPLDFLVSDARRLVQFMGYDPYRIPDYNYTTGITSFRVTHIWLTGLASFHRVGDVSLGFQEHVFHGGVHMGTTTLGGSCRWELSLGGYISKAGTAQFSVDYVQALVQLSQPLDTRKKPKLDKFEFKLGDFDIRVSGTGTFDYVIEIVANVLPNILRYQIMSIIEYKVKTGLQDALNKVNIDEIVEERLEMLDRMAEES